MFKAFASTSYATRSSHYSSRAKAMHSTAPILPSCNYCGNHAHKVSECNIPFKDLFCAYCGKRDIKSCLFCQISETKVTSIITVKFTNIFRCLSTKSQGTSAFHSSFPTKGNSNKNVKKKEHNANKREVLQAHAIQDQILQNELKSLKANLLI
jgi:hypothetical protein